MPWRILNLDLYGEAPHLLLGDLDNGIYLRTFFTPPGVQVDIGVPGVLGSTRVRAHVCREYVEVQATSFTLHDMRVLDSVLASIDVSEEDRRVAFEWTNGLKPDDKGVLTGNVESFDQDPKLWPKTLADSELLDAIADKLSSKVRRQLLISEAMARGLEHALIQAPRCSQT